MNDRGAAGHIVRVNGPLVEVAAMGRVAMSDVVELGTLRIPAEVVTVARDRVTAQAYEYLGGLRIGDPALGLGRPLSAPLGPGLLGGTIDGLLRPLTGGRVASAGRARRAQPAGRVRAPQR